MNPRISARRLGGLVCAGALAVATIAVTAPPASAAAYDGQAVAQADLNTSNDGSTGNCVFTSGSDAPVTQTVPFSSNGVPANASASSSGTVQDDGETADTTNLSASVSGSASATEAGGSIKTFDMQANMSASVSPAQGASSNCDSDANASFTTLGMVTVTSTQIMVLRADARGGTAIVVLQDTGATVATATINVGTNDRERRVVTVPAGTYQLQAVSGVSVDTPSSAGEATSANASVEFHARFYAPGAAPAKRTGTGKKYMKLPGSLDCANDRVVADFTNKAGKKATAANGLDPVIRSAAFFVNDDKVKTKRKPNKNTKVKLKNLDTTDEVEVEAVLKLWDKHKVAVSRSYLPCS